MKVTVLYGGPSAEREVSLISGRAVMQGLRQAGHEVFGSDISPDNLSALDVPADVVFPVLHGAFGESGELQEFLEQRGIPFVGSSAKSSRIGIDKVLTKQVWEQANLPTPACEVVVREEFAAGRAPAQVQPPCVVKPIDSGSSIDVFICRTDNDRFDACDRVAHEHGRAMIEQYIEGIEVTVAILEQRALSPIRITTSREFFDYSAKYIGNDAEHRFDLNLPAPLVQQIQELSARAHSILGCRDLSRVDLMIDRQMRPWLLEINTMPGFTPKSLLPEAAAHDGISFAQLVDRLVCRAYQRSGKFDARRHVA